MACRFIFRSVLVACSLALLSGCGGADSDPQDGKWVAASSNPLLSLAGSGTWEEVATTPAFQIVHAWVDARVANTRFNKRVFVEVDVPYENGSHIRTLNPAWYKSGLGDGYERWGTDAVEVYPRSGPNGSPMLGKAMCRLRMQHDQNNDGIDEMLVTDWQALYGEGTLIAPSSDPWETGWTSPTRANTEENHPVSVFFSPFDDPGSVVAQEIDAVRKAKSLDPSSRHTIHASVFNINDPRIVQRLISAHREGVEVRLVTEGHKFRPSATWQTGDDDLYAAGVPLLGVMHPGNGSMHTKYVIFDGAKVATGSFNWETGSSFENHENMVLTDDPQLVAAYAKRFDAIAGEPLRSRSEASSLNAARSAFFGPDEQLHRVVGQLIDSAKKSLHIAMFTAKDFEFNENGQRTSLFKKIVAAKKRGVDIRFMTDRDIAEASEYFGVVSSDDQTDEWLESQGVPVILANPQFAQYSSMHHKFMVVDGEAVATGAFNWYYDSALLNDEDLLILRDSSLAARFIGEFADLARRYDPAYKATSFPMVELSLSVRNNSTVFGENVFLLGDLPELGAWNSSQAIALDPSAWPQWSTKLQIPGGVRMDFKFLTRRSDASLSWETGVNRSYTVPTGDKSAKASFNYRY